MDIVNNVHVIEIFTRGYPVNDDAGGEHYERRMGVIHWMFEIGDGTRVRPISVPRAAVTPREQTRLRIQLPGIRKARVETTEITKLHYQRRVTYRVYIHVLNAFQVEWPVDKDGVSLCALWEELWDDFTGVGFLVNDHGSINLKTMTESQSHYL
ncbi:hypothetical protein BASA60_008965 [Batrachochytrium salamandrivorans]|nr:hypothetical protein BASA60_008965 [Batrachochytrium salamandrivorans]